MPAEKGNQNRTIHGGAGAVRAISRGEAFRGLAAKEEQAVKQDLADQGRVALVEENAIRLQTACRLYWGAVQQAAEQGDLERLDSYIRSFGWLAGASLRAWAELRKEAKDQPPALDYDAIIAEMKRED